MERVRAAATRPLGAERRPRGYVAQVPEFDPASASPWRLRLQIALAWFGLVSDPFEEREGGDTKRARDLKTRRPEWARVLFAAAIPLWAADRVDGWWYAAFVALAVPGGVIELVRWKTHSYERGRVDTALSLLQFWPMCGLLVFLVLGDDVSGGAALAYGAASMVVLGAALWAAIVLLARGADSTARD